MALCSSMAFSDDKVKQTSITAVHRDIIENHILTRLDGPTLASVACASPLLHQLCTQELLWRELCRSTWTTSSDPRVQNIIATFEAGHRSFFSDCSTTLHSSRGRPTPNHNNRPLPTPELISAVEVRYKNKLIYSKVEVTETLTESFRSSPFWVELLDPKETVRTPVKLEDSFLLHVEQSMTLSWIMIDPTLKRAANLSSLRPVSVRRHWLTGAVQLRYATIVGDVQCMITVTCDGKEGGELELREVNLRVEDMDKKCLSWEDSLVILQGALQSGQRKKTRIGKEKQRYENYREMRRERSKRKQRRERKVEVVCTAISVTISMALVLWLIGAILC